MKSLFQKINIDYNKRLQIPSLDGIRGIAIIGIMLYHFFEMPYGAWFSMDLFFVLSGFLITGILLDSKTDKHYYKNFIVRRGLRILPLYYGVLIIFFIVVPLIVNKSGLAPFSVYYDNQFYFWVYLQNWILLLKEPELIGKGRIFLHLWSLAIEEQFYIVWPIVILLFNIKNLVKIIVALILLSAALNCYYFFSNHSWQYTYFSTLCRLDSLCIGALIAVAVRNSSFISKLEKITPYIFKILFAVLLTAIFVGRPKAPADQFLEPVSTLLFSIFFASMILYGFSNHKNNFVKRILELKALRFFGKYSYSMYIFHVPILILLRPALFKYLQKNIPHTIAYITDNLICLLLVIAVSQLTWYLIEKPFLKLKRFFNHSITKTDSVTYSVIQQPPIVINNVIK
ncbi:MAG TPA: acyltransferase [Parafilimonas sp.]|nr:acyltransferase [Parafilimonas sp.]